MNEQVVDPLKKQMELFEFFETPTTTVDDAIKNYQEQQPKYPCNISEAEEIRSRLGHQVIGSEVLF